MLALLAAVMLGTQGKPVKAIATEPPAILVYWMPGLVYPPREMEIEVAIWKSGKVLWRDPAPSWSRTSGKWAMNSGKYMTASLKPADVSACLSRLTATGAFKVKNWYNAPPDTSTTQIAARSGKSMVHLASWVSPKLTAGMSSRDRDATTAWTTIHREARALIPKSGAATKRPASSQISDWASAMRR